MKLGQTVTHKLRMTPFKGHATVAKFYSARSRTIPPLPWQTFALPFSYRAVDNARAARSIQSDYALGRRSSDLCKLPLCCSVVPENPSHLLRCNRRSPLLPMGCKHFFTLPARPHHENGTSLVLRGVASENVQSRARHKSPFPLCFSLRRG